MQARGGIVLCLLIGCGAPPPAKPGTGAAEAARQFFDAIVAQDWKTGYAVLHPESQAKVSVSEFERLGGQYRRNLGFDPEEARLRFCEERGEEASAHVMIHGHAAGKARHFKEAVLLRKTDSGWHVLLPARFGRK
jgi:hypothetical protein